MNLFGGIASLFVGLYSAHKEADRMKLGLEMLLSFWLTGAAAWGTTGLAILQQTQSPMMALAGGFFTGLVAGSGAAFIRFQASPLSKGMGITTSGDVTKAASATLQNGGTDLQK